jgi:hypothetical protein
VDWRLGEWGDKFIGVYTDANIVMGDESGLISYFTVGIRRSLRMTESGTCPGAFTISRKTLD